MGIVSHLSFGVRDLDRAVRFYDALLAPLGVVRLWNVPGGAGYGRPGGEDELALFVQPRLGAATALGPPAEVAPGPGFHLALKAPDEAAVGDAWAAAIAAGGSDEGAPGPRPRYGAGYYAAFVRDPDGFKLELKVEVEAEPPSL